MGILVQNGISHTAIREENDYYATHPDAMYQLLKYETFNECVWECACGEGNLSEVLKEYGYDVYSTDLIDRGYQDEQLDFLNCSIKFNGDIITNPPFKHTTEFVLKALDSVPMGNKVAMFLKINYLSGKKRYKEIYSKYPPYRVYVFSGRIACSKNNKPEGFKNGDSCHEKAPRGSKTGTQGLKGSKERSIIPEDLCNHIVDICEMMNIS